MAVDGLLAARPSSLIAPRGVCGVVEATRSRARVGGSRHTTAHYRLQGVSWWRIGWGHRKSFPRPVLAQPLWGGFRSFLEIVRGVTVEHKMISRGVVRLHLGFLGWRGSSLGRLSSHLRRKGPAGGNAFSRSLCSPTAIAVSRGLPLSTSSILMWSGRRSMHFGPQRARRCNTSRI